MSKKSVRGKESHLKSWTAAIMGSLFLSSVQSAQAAGDDRPKFREFRDNNPGIDRQTLRHMFREQYRGVDHSGTGIIPPNTNVRVEAQNIRANAPELQNTLTRRLERHSGVLSKSVQQLSGGQTVTLANGVNLDLSSTDRNITLGEKLFNSVDSVEIEVGGQTKTLTTGSQVTAAEYVAAKQVLSGFGQTVILSSAGSATGGNIDLSAITCTGDTMRASDLVVPVEVTTRGDFSKGSDFILSGDLSNYGTVQTFDADGQGRGGTIRADDIFNAQSGQIIAENDLHLAANGTLANQGSITANGDLTLTASNINNSGTIASSNGNVNLDASTSTVDLNVNNAGGTISAGNGAINVRGADYAGTANTNLELS